MTSGCSGSVDKAGGAVPEPTRTLKLLNPRWGVEVEPFVDEVAKLSEGVLVVEQGEQFERGSPDSEVEAIKAVQAGRTDLAVIPVRAFGLVGMRSFDALIAPMEIDSMSLQEQVLSSDIATDMVSGVEGLGLRGIGILPGPMRFPSRNHQTIAHAGRVQRSSNRLQLVSGSRAKPANTGRYPGEERLRGRRYEWL